MMPPLTYVGKWGGSGPTSDREPVCPFADCHRAIVIAGHFKERGELKQIGAGRVRARGWAMRFRSSIVIPAEAGIQWRCGCGSFPRR